MSPSWPHLILGGGLGLAVLMLVLWLIHLPLRNAALVDFGWAAGLASTRASCRPSRTVDGP